LPILKYVFWGVLFFSLPSFAETNVFEWTAQMEKARIAYPLEEPAEQEQTEETHPLLSSFLAKEPIVVEAFDSSISVQSPWHEWMSKKKADARHTLGWMQTHAQGHISTVSWIDSHHPSSFVVPLLNENTLAFLKKKGGFSQEDNKGLIFGKIASGMMISFSEITQEVLYFDSHFHLLSPEDYQQDRFFLVNSVQPGTQFAHVHFLEKNPKKLFSTSLAIPMIQGSASYLDLSFYKIAFLRGKVKTEGVSSEGVYRKDLDQVLVEVVGSSEKSIAKSDKKGNFYIRRFLLVGAYPTYLESYRKGGYTHRYCIFSGQNNVVFVRYPVARIRSWVKDADLQEAPTGMIVSALSSLDQKKIKRAQKKTKARIFGQVTLYEDPDTLVGASGTLHQVNAQDQLVSSHVFSGKESYFVSFLQVKESLGFIQSFEAENGFEKVFSELSVTSKDVITVLGSHEDEGI
jgi:hypothetical protein